MKKVILLATILSYVSITAFAQHEHGNHQKEIDKPVTGSGSRSAVTGASSKQQLSQMLSLYYNIKNALVSGDVTSASTNAAQFLRVVNTIDFKVISEGNIQILSRDAGKLSNTKDLEQQRELFAALSSNMVAIVKVLKPGNEPVHVQYCPMKKASWLSSEKQIRNPYYGSSMLTCGEVTETL